MDGLTNGPGSWCVRWRPAPDARLRLFCLPHAGGGAVAYRDLAERMAPDVEVIAIRPPGREARFREPLLHRLDDIVRALAPEVEAWLDRPYAWFGHSMGALVAFEACRELRRRDLPAPVRLLVSARPAPHLPVRDPIHDAPAGAFAARLRHMGGTPTELTDDPEVFNFMLPILRADFTATETYRHEEEPPLERPISVFGGRADPFATVDELSAWQRHTTAETSLRVFHGGHFYLHQHQERLTAEILTDLGTAISADPVIVATGGRSQ